LAFKETGLVGIISLLTSILLHSGPPRGNPTLVPLPHAVENLVLIAIKILNNVAHLDLKFLQSALGSDEYAIEFFHLIRYLLWYCISTLEQHASNNSTSKNAQNSSTYSTNHIQITNLLHEVILMVGYFTLQNERNQDIIQWGHSPSIIQRTCNLPFQYFSDDKLKQIVFPTLISMCYGNSHAKGILQQEMSGDLIVQFIKNERNREELVKDLSSCFYFKNRFPRQLWDGAETFFYCNINSY